MALVARILKVHCNPWLSMDSLGRPMGACPKERLTIHVGQRQGFIACSLVAGKPEKLPKGHAGTPAQDTCYHFSRNIVQVVDGPNGYYRDRLKAGEIFPADKTTAKIAGVKFVPFETALEDARQKAIAKFRAAHGADPPIVDPFQMPTPIGKEETAK
jgi:hypothetical protein